MDAVHARLHAVCRAGQAGSEQGWWCVGLRWALRAGDGRQEGANGNRVTAGFPRARAGA